MEMSQRYLLCSSFRRGKLAHTDLALVSVVHKALHEIGTLYSLAGWCDSNGCGWSGIDQAVTDPDDTNHECHQDTQGSNYFYYPLRLRWPVYLRKRPCSKIY